MSMRCFSLGLILLTLWGQSCHAEDSAKEFSVASVKPSNPNGSRAINFTICGGRLTVTNYTFKQLMHEAYDTQDFQVIGAPTWAGADRYDVLASAEGEPTKQEFRQMLQRLLQDRFQLKLHNELKNQDVYELRVAKKGHKLKESAPDTEPWWSFGRASQIQARGVSMPWLANELTRDLQHFVLDKTGLAGNYDFSLGAWSHGVGTQAEESSGNIPSIFTAVQEDLGLTLTAAKAPVKVLVIEHLERPSAN
jgi:uncharacterized protein (TIGR03435 family)